RRRSAPPRRCVPARRDGGRPLRRHVVGRPLMRTREIRLRARPRGLPQETDFELAEVEVEQPADGELLIRNELMSVDPYMRGRMNDVRSYMPPFQLGQPLAGGAVGRVIASRNPDYDEGDWVFSMLGWRE